MKSKGNSLYEVLKSASRPAGADEGAAASPEAPAASAAEGSTLQERLAAYKAAKLAAATQPSSGPAIEAAPAKPAAATIVLEPDPTPIPAPPRYETTAAAPAPSEPEETPLPAPSKGPGERVVRLTYNTALFGGMIAVGLLFIAYAVGLHVGKGNAMTELQTPDVARPVVKAPPPFVPSAPPSVPTPPPARKEYTIRLGEWKSAVPSERVKGQSLADDADLKKTLERAGHKNFEQALIKRGPNDIRLALYVDRFSDLNAEAAKAALTAMKTFKFKSTTPFDKAVFEEVQSK